MPRHHQHRNQSAQVDSQTAQKVALPPILITNRWQYQAPYGKTREEHHSKETYGKFTFAIHVELVHPVVERDGVIIDSLKFHCVLMFAEIIWFAIVGVGGYGYPLLVNQLLTCVFWIEEEIAETVYHIARGVDAKHGGDVCEKLEFAIAALLFHELIESRKIAVLDLRIRMHLPLDFRAYRLECFLFVDFIDFGIHVILIKLEILF